MHAKGTKVLDETLMYYNGHGLVDFQLRTTYYNKWVVDYNYKIIKTQSQHMFIKITYDDKNMLPIFYTLVTCL